MRLRASIVVVAYNMARELPRTVRSLSPPLQRGIEAADFELIIVDNGSTEPFDESECRRWSPHLIMLKTEGSSPSPAEAVNAGIEAARADLIGVFIDGARLVSPGLVSLSVMAAALHPRPIIVTLAFHLGRLPQYESVRLGYDAREEDRLLASVNWPEDPYRLFDISVVAGSSRGGWFGALAESNGIFMPRALWTELGGFDERFQSPGGGLVNLDLFARAVRLPESQVVTLLGEGTFHQVHGGEATSARRRYQDLREEYRMIHGSDFQVPTYRSLYLGFLHPAAMRSLSSDETRLSGVAP